MPNGRERTRVAVPYLHAWRMKRLLSQDELAAKAHIAKTTVVRLEAGQTAILSTIGKLADALGITREQLVREDPDASAYHAKHKGAA